MKRSKQTTCSILPALASVCVCVISRQTVRGVKSMSGVLFQEASRVNKQKTRVRMLFLHRSIHIVFAEFPCLSLSLLPSFCIHFSPPLLPLPPRVLPCAPEAQLWPQLRRSLSSLFLSSFVTVMRDDRKVLALITARVGVRRKGNATGMQRKMW